MRVHKIFRQLILFFLIQTFVFGSDKINSSPTKYKYVPSEFNNLRIYQVMVEAFIDGDPLINYEDGYGPSHHCGDLKGITDALPYIKSLGMNGIWLTPIFDSECGTPSFNPDKQPNIKLDATGYFTRNYFKIDPNFGTMEDAKTLVKKAHELEMYVFFDGVFGHHKGKVRKSPNGNLPYGRSDHVSYPESLEFYKEVALYWIDELEIDGWRLDQAYQIPVKYLNEIRMAIETKCQERKLAGKKWGTLGYVVGEIWHTTKIISKKGYGSNENPGLLSCFDFPLRYKLVQTLAVEEKGYGRQSASILKDGMLSHNIYAKHAIPNLMLTNHDLVRFGDLIQRAGLGGKENREYWERHKCALSFLAAYTGPITIYYGDEIGDEVQNFASKIDDPKEKCWEKGLCDDHVSRTSGKIFNLDTNEMDLANHLTKLMKLRQNHPALYNGETTNIKAGESLYIDYKVYLSDRIVYILNISSKEKTVTIKNNDISGNKLINLFDNSEINLTGQKFQFSVDGLTGNFYLVK